MAMSNIFLDFSSKNESLDELNSSSPLNYTPFTTKDKIKSYNRIIFGAPGTGKSFRLNKESNESNFTEITRVTFHPDYSYSQFVGTYKPVMVKNRNEVTVENASAMNGAASEKEEIAYKYVPGPFLRTLVAALKSGRTENPQNYLLIIEEINRARVAAVFGDVFQLLDRNADGESEYKIQTSEDLRNFLSEPEQLGGKPDDYKTLKLPNNFYIWATMNSADQGVFPMDTAFKRRWNFEYIGVNDKETVEQIKDIKLPIKDSNGKSIKWDLFRRTINKRLLSVCKVNEDKLLGAFFISKTDLEKANKCAEQDNTESTKAKEEFINLFKSKVLMYLYEDAAKMRVKDFFAGVSKDDMTYSKVCEEFERNGIEVFGEDFKKEVDSASQNGESN